MVLTSMAMYLPEGAVSFVMNDYNGVEASTTSQVVRGTSRSIFGCAQGRGDTCSVMFDSSGGYLSVFTPDIMLSEASMLLDYGHRHQS